jgi:hypothetical protein
MITAKKELFPKFGNLTEKRHTIQSCKQSNSLRWQKFREFIQPPVLREVLPGAKGLATVI